ncbi:PE domain-containing protein [Pseudonocardia sp. RS010]|uniref:PE domain-containing protein n=1 Tax=Pseudonocardia sp. RS010 TaxID=3385979 RepID=UPI0039A37AA3
MIDGREGTPVVEAPRGAGRAGRDPIVFTIATGSARTGPSGGVRCDHPGMTAPRWDEPEPVPTRLPYTISYSPVLRVDPEMVEGLVGRLAGVIEEIALTEARLQSFMSVTPPGNDEISRNAARQAAKMVEGATRYLADWRSKLIQAGAALRVQSKSYVGSDRSA